MVILLNKKTIQLVKNNVLIVIDIEIYNALFYMYILFIFGMKDGIYHQFLSVSQQRISYHQKSCIFILYFSEKHEYSERSDNTSQFQYSQNDFTQHSQDFFNSQPQMSSGSDVCCYQYFNQTIFWTKVFIRF